MLHPLRFLPNELIFQILLWLPVRSLLLFKCVCKSWKTLISAPQFAKNHLTVNPSIAHERIFSDNFIIDGQPKIFSLPMKSLLGKSSEPAAEYSMKHSFIIVGSCNGLLCLFDMDQGYVKLWNPSIRFESKKSPIIIDFYDDRQYITYHRGFGYDQVSDKYKVLVVVRHSFSEKVLTRIYTFGRNSWTTIKNFPYPPTRFQGKLVSGTLNWVIVKRGDSSNQHVILSFDLEKETYNELLLPNNDGVNNNACNPTVGVLSNCLCVCFDSNKTHWDLWLMKKYGVVESWTRLVMIPQENLLDSVQRRPSYVIEPFFIAENSIVLLKMYPKFIMYDLNNGRLDLDVLPGNILSNHHIYYESLISPQL